MTLWGVGELSAGARHASRPADRPARRRRSRGHHLHVGNHRRRERRGALAQQSRDERHHAHRRVAHHRSRSLSRGAAAVPRPRPRNGVHCWLISGCRCAARAVRPAHAAEMFIPADGVLRRADGVRPLLDPAVVSDDEARGSAQRAALRLRLGAAAGARARGVPRALRPHDPRALRHERGADDHDQSVRGRTARRLGGLPLPGVSARLVDEDGAWSATTRSARWRSVAAPLRRLLAPPRRDAAASTTAGSAPATSRCARPTATTLRGRRGDLIICGGFNIYPREIEELLLEDRACREAAVVGMPTRCAAKSRSPTSSPTTSLDTRELEPTAARSWRRSRCRARSSGWKRCRERRSAKFRSTCCRHGRKRSVASDGLWRSETRA